MAPEIGAPAILRLSPDIADLARLHPWLVAAAAHAGFCAAIRNAMHVALEEVVANIAMHAFPAPARSGGEIIIALSAPSAGAVLVVEDNGLVFDPSLAPPLPRPKSIEDALPGGLGLTLLRHYCRDVRYERVGARNRLTLNFPR